MTLQLNATCMPNPRITPLVDGKVQAKGIELLWNVQVGLNHGRVLLPYRFLDNILFDKLQFSEMPISETLITVDRKSTLGRGRWDWWALPVYLTRAHFWTGIVVNPASGIQSLGDLKGKQVGVLDYCMTAAIWMKIALKELYDVEATDISWNNLLPRGESPALAFELDVDPPPGVTIKWLTQEHDPISMLERGELDAAMGLSGPRLNNNPNIKQLLPDNGEQLIREFYHKTGCFMPNHHFVIQRRLVDQQPELMLELLSAFEQSKQTAYGQSNGAPSAYLYFEGSDSAQQAGVFGDDPYPLGIGAMKHSLQRLIQGSLEQGVIRRRVSLDEIYHPTMLAT